jgi:hypothetical protein
MEGRQMGRIIFGGLLAGVVVFFWGFVSHMLLPVGEMGILNIPNEESVLGAMRNSIQRPGFYLFPYMDPKDTSEASHKALLEKQKKGPVGVMVVHPEGTGGAEPVSPQRLGTELATNVLCAMLAALLLAQARPTLGYLGRVAFVTMLGIFGFVMVHVPFWNWYGFPLDFSAGQGIGHVVGWLLAGIVLAAIVRPKKVKIEEKVPA